MDRIEKAYDNVLNISVITSLDQPLDIPSRKNVLLLDGGSDINSNIMNRTFEEKRNHNFVGKLMAMDRIFPHVISPEEAEYRDNHQASFHDFLSSSNDLTPSEKRVGKYRLKWEYHRDLSQFYSNKLRAIKIIFHNEEEMTLEYFSALIAENGYPEYIIVPDYFTYEHLPSEGKLKEIETSEGIVEAWEIGGITIFYMPLSLYMSDEQITLWHQVLSEILV